VVRARYTENIKNGKIGSSVYASKLLFSVYVAIKHIDEKLDDWTCLHMQNLPFF
jgi:hypothetical protein